MSPGAVGVWGVLYWTLNFQDKHQMLFRIVYCCVMLVRNGVIYDTVQALVINISACQADSKPTYSYSDKANKYYVQWGMSMCLLLHVHQKDSCSLILKQQPASNEVYKTSPHNILPTSNPIYIPYIHD